MRLALRMTLLALAAAGCAGQGTPTMNSAAPTTNTPSQDVVIQVGDMDVAPSVARVKQGGRVSWVSVSTNFRPTLSFPATIVDRFTCKELRPQFFLADDRLMSIAMGADMEAVALPCPLKPGTYDYRIELTSGGEGVGGRSMGMNPQGQLKATLIVE